MSRRDRALIIIVIALIAAAVLAPDALAAAGGGSAGYSGGGGGGGGRGGHGNGFALYFIFRLLFDIALLGHGLGALFLVGAALLWFFGPRLMAWMRARQQTGPAARRETRKRERRVELAAAEAADEDPIFAPENVRAAAASLFTQIQFAWDAADRVKLRGLVAPSLLDEWERRLDDFDSKGWRNRIELLEEPTVEYVGLANREGDEDDRVVVRIEARMRDYVTDSTGRHLKRSGQFTETVRLREFWTLQRRGDHWILASIERGGEGAHALRGKIVASNWSDEDAMRDEAMIEGAVADAVPEGTAVSEVAPLEFSGDAHAAAMDLSLADGRFAPDVLEIAARRAVDAWAEAVDGDDAGLLKIADAGAVREMLHPGDSNQRTRLVVRGPQVTQIRVTGLDAHATPPTMTIDVEVTGRRYTEDRDTTAVLSGNPAKAAKFTERWKLALTDDPAQPWRIVAVLAPTAAV